MGKWMSLMTAESMPELAVMAGAFSSLTDIKEEVSVLLMVSGRCRLSDSFPFICVSL